MWRGLFLAANPLWRIIEFLYCILLPKFTSVSVWLLWCISVLTVVFFNTLACGQQVYIVQVALYWDCTPYFNKFSCTSPATMQRCVHELCTRVPTWVGILACLYGALTAALSWPAGILSYNCSWWPQISLLGSDGSLGSALLHMPFSSGPLCGW